MDHPQPQWPDDHAELDHAILADPDDDAPRWALARHMQARGEPRGDFIAIQLEMAEIRRSSDRDVRAWGDHLDRANRLLDRHRAWWLPPLPEFARRPIFVRGFVECVEVDAESFLSRADELYRVAPIRSLGAVGVAACVDRFFASPHLARVFALDLWANHLGDNGLRVLSASLQLGKLRWLDIRQNDLTSVSITTLRKSRISERLRYVAWDGEGPDPAYGTRDCDPPWMRSALLHENAFPPMPEDVDDIAHR